MRQPLTRANRAANGHFSRTLGASSKISWGMASSRGGSIDHRGVGVQSTLRRWSGHSPYRNTMSIGTFEKCERGDQSTSRRCVDIFYRTSHNVNRLSNLTSPARTLQREIEMARAEGECQQRVVRDHPNAQDS